MNIDTGAFDSIILELVSVSILGIVLAFFGTALLSSRLTPLILQLLVAGVAINAGI